MSEDRSREFRGALEYTRFMGLKANAEEIIGFLEASNFSKGINWRGTSKSDLAMAYVRRDHITDDAFQKLVERFSTKRR